MMLAFGPLGFAPKIFWTMSPLELQAAIDGLCGGGFAGAAGVSLSRPGLEALQQQFPDGGEYEWRE